MDGLIMIGFLILCWVVFVTVAAIYLLIRVRRLHKEMYFFHKRIKNLENGRTAPAEKKHPAEQPIKPDIQQETKQETKLKPEKAEPPKEELLEIHEPVHKKEAEPASAPVKESAAQRSAPPEDLPPNAIDAVLAFLKGGNAWVAVGVLFVVLGLTFGYLYVAEHIPDEAKIAGGFLLGMALFALGWKQRIKRRIFGMVVQGGGIGAMYLTLFASVKIYELLPLELVFSLMTLLIFLSAALSMLQNSQVMAIFSAVIGFMAPLLLSSGSGNYIVLFSYYIMINLSIMAASFKKYWRYLNSIGFVFTFTVAIIWGASRYIPDYFWNVEIFLVCFFLIYTAINISATLRQPSNIIENAFAITTSFTYITLQLILTVNYEYGQSIASASLGAFYIALSYALAMFNTQKLRNLITMYLGLGIVFVNMTVPLALDGAWIAGIWAVEGAALVMMGVYQKNKFFRWFGGVLIVLGTFSAWREENYYYYTTREFMLSSVFLVRMFASAALLVSAECYRRVEGVEKRVVSLVAVSFGFLMWYTTFINELKLLPAGYEYNILLAYVSLSAVLFAFLANKVRWDNIKYIIFSLLVYVILLIAGLSVINWRGFGLNFRMFPDMFLLTEYRWVGWLSFFVCSTVTLYFFTMRERRLHDMINRASHAAMLFVAVIFTASNIAYAVFLVSGKLPYIYYAVGLMFTATALWLTTKIPQKLQYAREYAFWGASALAVYMLIGVFSTNSYPLPVKGLTVPFVNFLDLPAMVAFASVFYWLIKSRYFYNYISEKVYRISLAVTGIVAFIWLHCVIGRAVVFAFNGYYDFDWLMDSGPYQLIIAVLWGITGFVLMKTGHRIAKRRLWVSGAVLLALDSVKLLMIDLSRVGTLPRVGSFMIVGLLFIAIGYFVPLPPKEKTDETD